ncbi:biotin transporter BioY [Paracoccus sp. (in: a-proteobacteria)]|uniref:biotin transporter BioY n=1 Tax=Paracoccus sp. TaxID=267 RepID=UPI003A86E6E7
MERSVVLIALFAAMIAVLGLVPPITLGFGVPITAQSLGVMLCGTILGAKRGALAVLLFQLLIAMGLPLLSGGRGGLGIIVSPTGGFFLGWLPAAFVTGLIVERLRIGSLAVVAAIASIIGGIVVLYACGIIGMSLTLSKSLAEATALVLAFIPGDAVKAVIAGLLTSALAKARPSVVLSRSAAK